MKYKLSLVVAFSSCTGYFLSLNSFGPALIPLFSGVFFLASGAAVLNQYTEREQDSRMERTMNRPIPSKKVTDTLVKVLIAVLLFSGSFLLLLNGMIPFMLGIINVVLYNLVYTSLKKITSLAVIPGALVGAIPPIIGFTSAGGILSEYKILLFSTFMVLWQIPHFWLLLIRYGKEYRNAGFITISDYLNEKQIRNIIFFWIVFTSFFLIFFFGLADSFSKFFSYIIIILNPLFIFLFSKMLFSQKKVYDLKSAFLMLNAFGIIIMLLLIVDSFLTGP